jgi:hypothetical protein
MILTNRSFEHVTPYAIHQHLPSIWDQRGSETLGPDSEKRNTQADLVAEHWSSRPTLILLAAQADNITYEHVALTPGRTIKTRYHYIGHLPAMEFPEAD